MNTGLKEICRDLRWIADNMPQGAERNQMQADLVRLYMKLDAMPARVAARAAMKSAAEIEVVFAEEFGDAFRDVLKWFEDPLRVEIVAAITDAPLLH